MCGKTANDKAINKASNIPKCKREHILDTHNRDTGYMEWLKQWEITVPSCESQEWVPDPVTDWRCWQTFLV